MERLFIVQARYDAAISTLPYAARNSQSRSYKSTCNQQMGSKHLSTILSKYQDRSAFCGSPVGAEEPAASPAASTSCNLCTKSVCTHQITMHVSCFTVTLYNPLHKQASNYTAFNMHMECYKMNQHAENRATPSMCRSFAQTTCLGP